MPKSRLWYFIFKLFCKCGLGIFFYQSSFRLTYYLCGIQWLPILPHKHKKLDLDWLNFTKIEVADVQKYLQKSRTLNIWYGTLNIWKDLTKVTSPLKSDLNKDEINKLFKIKNFNMIEEFQKQGKGVILLYHHTATTVPFANYIHELFDQTITINFRIGKAKRDPLASKLSRLRQFKSAMKTLKEGKIVQVLADGQKGDAGIYLPIYGKQMGFRFGFPELLFQTNAVALPISTIFDFEARNFQATIEKPLERSYSKDTHEAEALVKQYSLSLIDYYASYPEQIEAKRKRLFLDFQDVT